MNSFLIVKKIYFRLRKKITNNYIDNLKKKGLKIGNNVMLLDNIFFDPSHCFLISIGDNCTLCPNVRLIAHDASIKKFLGYTKIGKIDIKEKCFIGDSAIILPNVTIGPNSIIGAGSVVTKDVPPNTIAAGNPAKVLIHLEDFIKEIKAISKNKKIFSEEYFIDRLDDAKRAEILQSIIKTIGFIV